MAVLEDREVVIMLLGIVVGSFAFAQRHKLSALPYVGLPVSAASILLLGWALSIAEGWFAPELLNLLEHVAYLTHSALMLTWVYILWTASKLASRAVNR